MPLNKWSAVEGILLLLFAAGLFMFYQLSLEANDKALPPANSFGSRTLRGALSIAFSKPGTIITTKDFNFFGPGEINVKEVLSGLKLSSSQVCLARGEADKRFFMGGTEAGFDSLIKYRAGSFGPYHFNVFCYNSAFLLSEIRKQQFNGFRPWYFSKCRCLKQGTCCVASIGKA